MAGDWGIGVPGFREPSATAARYAKLACNLRMHLQSGGVFSAYHKTTPRGEDGDR